jgi:acetoin utilization deacetylase AcuC-like enzyme
MQTVYSYAPASNHQFSNHPENPERLDLLDMESIPDVIALSFAPATLADAGRVHSAGMLEKLAADCREGAGVIDGAPTYVTMGSFQAALDAAGACMAVTRAVLKGEAKNGFAIVRPPGHHAEPERAMGFCLLNNAAIASFDALASGVERVMVVDYDAHHGNGTEKAFWNNPSAGYFSTHQENIYPGSGWMEDAPHAKGRIANFPLPAYSGDACFNLIFEEALAPLLKLFNPGLILVSAGFDAHWTDPLTSLGLSTNGYYAISKKLVEAAGEICGGKIVFILEGGYDPQNVANGVRAVFRALTGAKPMAVNDPSRFPEPDISMRVQAFRNRHGL